jgi:hypothetical protein
MRYALCIGINDYPSQDYPQTPGPDGSSTQRKWPVLT